MSGLFLSFEGGEAAGKSVQAGRLAESLGAGGRDVLHTREPGGTPFAERIRDVLLHAREVDLTPEAQALLFSAASVATIVSSGDSGKLLRCRQALRGKSLCNSVRRKSPPKVRL